VARLPVPGADNGSWGEILNEFLDVAHSGDGTLKDTGTLAAKANDVDVVHVNGAEAIAGTKTFNAPPVVPTPVNSLHAATKQYVDDSVTTPADATTTTKGIVQLAGDLAGTADVPTVPELAEKVSLLGGNSVTITNPALANGFAQINLDYTPDSSTPDGLAFYHNGVRTGYHNEKGELRSRAAATNSVPFRVQQRTTSQTANLTEWTQSDNTILSYVDAAGNIFAPNLTPSAWQDLTYPTNAAAAAGFAQAGVRLEPLTQVVRMRGAIQITAPGFANGVTIATVPAGYRPPATFRCITRFAGSGSAGVFITIATTGAITVAANLTSSDNVVAIDNISWPL